MNMEWIVLTLLLLLGGVVVFKLGARVQVSARRIVLHLPSAFPWLALWQAVALALGAHLG